MSLTKRRSALRTATIALALGALTVSGAASATAAPTVDPTEKGSLSIHKYEQPDTATGLPNNGTELSPGQVSGLTPIEDVEFSIQKVPGVDLTTNAGWQTAANMTVAQAAAAVAGPPVVTPLTGTTNAAGLVEFDNLDLGLYYVTETAPPPGASPVAPFLVTLPMTNPSNHNQWLYDVHVYPKNAITTAGKTVEDTSAIKVGDNVVWTITGDNPAGRTDAYRIVDVLDTKLDYVSTTVSLNNGTTLTAGTHYNVVHTAATNTVQIDLTDAGLDLIALPANQSAKIQAEITTTVNAVGVIENEADIYPNQPSIDSGNPVTTTPEETHFGNITLEKIDDAGDGLAGAKFKVYPTEADALAGTNAISIGGVSEWTSAAGGVVTISGLHYSNYDDGELIANSANWRYYWLVESEAPAGFELLAQPIRFAVTDHDTTIDLQIENVPARGGFELPLTGAQGVTTLATAGVLLLLGSAFMVASTRKRREATQA